MHVKLEIYGNDSCWCWCRFELCSYKYLKIAFRDLLQPMAMESQLLASVSSKFHLVPKIWITWRIEHEAWSVLRQKWSISMWPSSGPAYAEFRSWTFSLSFLHQSKRETGIDGSSILLGILEIVLHLQNPPFDAENPEEVQKKCRFHLFQSMNNELAASHSRKIQTWVCCCWSLLTVYLHIIYSQSSLLLLLRLNCPVILSFSSNFYFL